MPNVQHAKAVIRVGDGRGFVVRLPYSRGCFVITAAHCLPCVDRFEFVDLNYLKLLAPLGEKPSINATCAFVDPVADIAVLARQDDDIEHFFALIRQIRPLWIGKLPRFVDTDTTTRAFFFSRANGSHAR
jgi:hypothetical protein